MRIRSPFETIVRQCFMTLQLGVVASIVLKMVALIMHSLFLPGTEIVNQNTIRKFSAIGQDTVNKSQVGC